MGGMARGATSEVFSFGGRRIVAMGAAGETETNKTYRRLVYENARCELNPSAGACSCFGTNGDSSLH
jgi:hypothetical protein